MNDGRIPATGLPTRYDRLPVEAAAATSPTTAPHGSPLAGTPGVAGPHRRGTA